jgi:UDP-glucose 4-epimerase
MTVSLVTGGAGFIGSHLVRALLARGDDVRVFDNFSTGRAENLAGLAGRLEILTGDLRERAQLSAAMVGVDVVFHLAAFVSVPKSLLEPQVCFDVNVQGTLNLLEAARQADVRQVVMASSAAVYGDSQALPLREETELRVLSPYAAAKLTGEIYAGLYSRTLGLPVVCLRFFNVFGPRQSPFSDYAAVIPIFIRRLLEGQAPTIFGDGYQRRDFIYVDDVVRANLLAAATPEAAGLAFNICTGKEVSLLDLLETLSELLPGLPAPVFAPARPGDIYRSLGSPARAAAVLGFQAQVELAEGLAQTIAAMRSPQAVFLPGETP